MLSRLLKLIKIPYLLLIPSVHLTSDFLPGWYTLYISTVLFLLAFKALPKITIYLNFIPVYFIFKTVGLQIIPETTAPILILFVLSNLIQNNLQKKSLDYLYFFWIGILSIFFSDLYYLIYAVFSIIVFIYLENRSSDFNLKEVLISIKNNYKQILAGSLLVILLFIFFPRFHNFLPKSSTIRKGKIGYSKEINNSTSSNIQLSSQTAFYAEVDQEIPISTLYWRGRVNDITDGYNWRASNSSHTRSFKVINSKKVKLSTKLKYEQDFGGDLILLDTPLQIKQANVRYYHHKGTNTYKSYSKKKKAIISATATSESNISQSYSQKQLTFMTKLPGFVPKSIKEIAGNIKSAKPSIIINQFKRYLYREQFSYTLSPGPLPTLNSFIQSKKGYCTHFASFLGVLLRYKGIPARLVSGFQGGTYNELGKYFTVKSNDAHVWVEYFYKNKWHSADPTSYVSPNRINLGGELFFTQPDEIIKGQTRSNFVMSQFNYAKQYLDNLNYKVSLFFDNFDKAKQKELSESLSLSFKQFFTLGLVAILLLISFMYFLLRTKIKKTTNIHEKLLFRLDKKLKKKSVSLSDKKSIGEMIEAVNKASLPELTKESLLEIIQIYQKSRYSNSSSIDELTKKVKKFKFT